MPPQILALLPAFTHWFVRFLIVFVGWHWVLAVGNAAITVSLGLGLVAISPRWRSLRLSTTQRLNLRRLVLLAASAKAAMLLVIGEGLPRHSRSFLVCGFQLPDPEEFLGFSPRTVHSVWYPSTITAGVSIVLLGLAAASLIWRGAQLLRVQKNLHALTGIGSAEEPNANQHQVSRVRQVLHQAALGMDLPASFRLPSVVLVSLPCPTPLLLGLWRPCILLSPSLAAELTDGEMEMAFRHELAHLLRRDHLWRWVLMWIGDVGIVTGIVGWLASRAGAAEEELCDRLAVRSATEALLMGSAFTKSAGHVNPVLAGPVDIPLSLRATVVSSLQGRPSIWQSDARAYRQRLEQLVQLAGERRKETGHISAKPISAKQNATGCCTAKILWDAFKTGCARFFLGLLLFLVIYIKYIVYLNVF